MIGQIKLQKLENIMNSIIINSTCGSTKDCDAIYTENEEETKGLYKERQK